MAYDWGWQPYVSTAERRMRAMREMEKRKKQGHTLSPVVINGRGIVTTFWGKSWCTNLERYSDYANRLPRGRTYVRNGCVVDLQIEVGAIHALVCGSEMYEVDLKITPLGNTRWKSICAECSGSIDSLVELLQGKLSQSVMERICRPKEGLFPSPAEIKLACSCPDSARMCKHVAAVLYGIGARFDHQPELLFRLRDVDEKDLIANVGSGIALVKPGKASRRVLEGSDLADVFGLDMADGAGAEAPPPATPRKQAPRKRALKKPAAKPVKRKVRPT